MGKYYIDKIEQLTEDGHFIPELGDVYGTFSTEKMRTYNSCCREMYNFIDYFNKSKSGDNKLIMRPNDWGVIASNSARFTFGAILYVHSENYDYSATFYLIITADNIYFIQ